MFRGALGLGVMQEHCAVTAMEFSAHGQWVVTWEARDDVAIYHLDRILEIFFKDGRAPCPTEKVLFPDKAVQSLSFSADDPRLAVSVYANDSLVVWSTKTRERLAEFKGPRSTEVKVLSPDGKILFCGNYDEGFRLFDVETGQPKVRMGHEEVTDDFDEIMTMYHPEYRPDGRFIVTTGADNDLTFWNARFGEDPKSPMKVDVP